MKKILRIRTAMAVFFLFTLPMILGNSWLFIGNSQLQLSSFCTVSLDINPNVTSSINSGSVSDGDSITSITDQSSNAEVWGETGTNRPTWKANILNGRGVIRIDPSTQQRLKSSARTLVSAGSAFTIYAVIYLTSFDQQYKYFASFKGASSGASPSVAFSSNAGFKDLFFGADTTWSVNRWTTISSPTGAWKWIAIRYNGGTATTQSNYFGYNAGAALTRTGITGNDGDASNNLIGAYKTASNPYGWNGDIARFVLCSNDVGDSGVTSSFAAYNLQEYNF